MFHLFGFDILAPNQISNVYVRPDFWVIACAFRPHLHLEIRNAGQYIKAFNPMPLIDANWDALSLNGPSSPAFARDMDQPRRWQKLLDQPNISFWGPLLNNYAHAWPLAWGR